MRKANALINKFEFELLAQELNKKEKQIFNLIIKNIYLMGKESNTIKLSETYFDSKNIEINNFIEKISILTTTYIYGSDIINKSILFGGCFIEKTTNNESLVIFERNESFYQFLIKFNNKNNQYLIFNREPKSKYEKIILSLLIRNTKKDESECFLSIDVLSKKTKAPIKYTASQFRQKIIEASLPTLSLFLPNLKCDTVRQKGKKGISPKTIGFNFYWN